MLRPTRALQAGSVYVLLVAQCSAACMPSHDAHSRATCCPSLKASSLKASFVSFHPTPLLAGAGGQQERAGGAEHGGGGGAAAPAVQLHPTAARARQQHVRLQMCPPLAGVRPPAARARQQHVRRPLALVPRCGLLFTAAAGLFAAAGVAGRQPAKTPAPACCVFTFLPCLAFPFACCPLPLIALTCCCST